MAYDIEAIKRKIAALSGNQKNTGKREDNRPRLTYWKPPIGQTDIRILPYTDTNGQPVQEVSYYDSRLLTDSRFVVPAQFGLVDPIFDMLTDLRKDRSSKSSWQLFLKLRPRESYYLPILVRGEEGKGVQIWEINSKKLKELYATFAHPDYADENLTDPVDGYDFTVTVTPTDKTFNGFAIKDVKLQPRRKSSPLAASEAEREKIVSSIPNLEEFFKAQVKSEEKLNEIIENFLTKKDSVMEGMGATEGSSENSSEAPAGEVVGGAEDETPEPVPVKTSKTTKKKIDDAFSGLDD